MAQVPRHRFTLAAVYELPVGRGRAFGNNLNRVAEAFIGGWQLSSIVTWRSGLPLDVSLDPSGTDPITGRPVNFNNIPFDYGDLRPNRIRNPNTGISPSHDRFHFLNVNAFQLQPVDTPGNSQRKRARTQVGQTVREGGLSYPSGCLLGKTTVQTAAFLSI